MSTDSTKDTGPGREYGLFGRLTARPGKRDELVGLLLEAADHLRGVAGCRQWIVHESVDAPDDVWISEIWRSREDHDKSLGRPEIRGIIGDAMPLLDGQPQKGQETVPRGGVGAQHMEG